MRGSKDSARSNPKNGASDKRLSWSRLLCRMLATLLSVLKRSSRRKVPIRKQMTSSECGAACLAMILSYHGRDTGVAGCREQCGAGRDGVTALTIMRAAGHYGLRTKAYSLQPEDLQHASLPAIAHWNGNHFVVVEKWTTRKIVIVDPGIGRRYISPSEFEAAFTGILLTFEPETNFERGREPDRRAWREYLGYVLRTPGVRKVLGQVLLATLMLTALGLAVPLLMKVLVDQVLPFKMDGAIVVLGLGAVAVGLSQLVLGYLRATLLVYLRAKLDSRMMLGFFEHTLSLPFKFFQQRASGDLLMRLGSNATIRELLTGQTVSVILDGGLTLVYAVILLLVAPMFGLLAIAIGLAQMTILLLSTRRIHSLMQQDLAAQAESQGYLVEALTGIATLKAGGLEDRAFDKWSGLFFKQLNVSLRREQLTAVIGTVTSTLNVVSPIILLLAGAIYVLNGSMTLGTVLALSAMAASFLTPLASLISTIQQLQTVGAQFERISDVVQAEPEQDDRQVRTAPPLEGRIELKDVGFRYDPNGPWVLRDASLTVEPGQKIALVGRTGSGKSTLAKLLLGLYEPAEGEIFYDGVALRELNYRTLREQFGAVIQESFVFSGSILQNISLHDPEMPMEEVIEATKMAAIHDEIIEMPMGYETLVAEGGDALSGGQRQRLSLARALANRPVLLVLDEATSHLDAATENLVSRNVSHISCTRVVIAHRLSTIRDADVIFVIDNGEIVERGSHEELLAMGGNYATLVWSQLEHGVDSEASAQQEISG